ncbi:hypothetical protein PENTCL1PPCAC_11311, partial [Pristionchus entomophagus]
MKRMREERRKSCLSLWDLLPSQHSPLTPLSSTNDSTSESCSSISSCSRCFCSSQSEIIRLLVNYQSSSNDGHGSIESEIGISHLHLSCTSRLNFDVSEISVVSDTRVLSSMILVEGIVVASRGKTTIRQISLIKDVESVQSRCESIDCSIQSDSRVLLIEINHSDLFTGEFSRSRFEENCSATGKLHILSCCNGEKSRDENCLHSETK